MSFGPTSLFGVEVGLVVGDFDVGVRGVASEGEEEDEDESDELDDRF